MGRRFFLPVFLAMSMAACLALHAAADKETANVLYADPYGHLDQTVMVRVITVHPEHFESKVRDVVWFRARTGILESQSGHYHIKAGGEIVVAVDSDGGAEFYRTFGDERPGRADGFIQPHPLSGIFRAWDRLLKADPNERLVSHVSGNGAYFIDCTSKNQFKNVPAPTPTPGASPSPAADADASPSPSPGPDGFTGSFKSLMHRLGIH